MKIVNKTKILFIVTQSEFGGAQRYIFETVRLLDREQYEIVVAAGQGDGELFKKLQSINTKTVHLKQMKRVPWPWQVFLSVGEILKLLKKEKPDVLFLCSTTAGLLGSITRLFYKVKVVYRIGGWAFRDPRPFWKNWAILLAEKLTAPLKDKVIVNNEIDKELALKYKIVREANLVKIHNGLDIDSLVFFTKEEARQKLSINNALVIGTVANFYKTKGLAYLIEAAKEVKANFVIIGEGKERPKLTALIKKHRLENRVILAGRLPNAYQYLKAFDVFALPSLKEGFPWIILEAMAAGIPVVATNVGVLPEIIENEKEGILVEPKKPHALGEKINWLLDNPTEAKSMAGQAKEKLKKEFTSQKMMRETAEMLSKL